jgi:hypothetical protein
MGVRGPASGPEPRRAVGAGLASEADVLRALARYIVERDH